MTVEEHKKRQRERRLATCKHFNGIQHKACRAGIAYASFERDGKPYPPIPCLPADRPCPSTCAKREFPTLAEVEEREAEVMRSLDRTRIAMIAIIEKIGKWKKGMPGLQGEMPCPVCKTGKLGYSRAGYNGHIWGACTTKGCVRWMQ